MNTINNHSETKVVKAFLEDILSRQAIKAPKQTPERFLELLAQTIETKEKLQN